MRQARWLRLAHGLALCAMLLLVTGPLLGQWLVPAAPSGMADMAGMDCHGASPASARTPVHEQAQDMAHEHAVPWAKCGYCDLPFHSPAASGSLVLLPASRHFAAPLPSPLPAAPVLQRHYPRAASRAPPTIS